jgi:hypothetical protein
MCEAAATKKKYLALMKGLVKFLESEPVANRSLSPYESEISVNMIDDATRTPPPSRRNMDESKISRVSNVLGLRPAKKSRKRQKFMRG